MNPFSLALESIVNFSMSDTVSQISQALHNVNFIQWFKLYGMNWSQISALAADGSNGFSATSFGQYCAQYAAVMTNWAYTLAAVFSIILLLCKKNKKWFWYIFFAITAVMSVTSVGMHTADYGEFAPGIITTKLLASFVDMSFTELMAWSGVICFVFEFYNDNINKRNRIAKIVTAWAIFVLLMLAFEVFVQKNRPLWIGGRDEFGMPYDMGGDHGGLSFAEFGCFITCLPLPVVLITRFRTLPKNEIGSVILLLATFLLAFIITSIWGDNEINSIALGNLQGHSLWHLLTAIGTFVACFWVDTRTGNENKKSEIDLAVKTALEEYKSQISSMTESESETGTSSN